MMLTKFILVVKLGLSLDIVSSEHSIPKTIGNHIISIGQKIYTAIRGTKDEAAYFSEHHTTELIERLIQASEGSSPVEVSPKRFLPLSSVPEHVASIPNSEAEAYRAVHHAGLSYCPASAVRNMICKACRRLGGGVEVIDIFTDYTYQGRAVLLFDKHHNQIVLSYRGSLFLENWIQDLVYLMAPVPYAKGAKIQLGFKQMHQKLYTDIIGPLREALDKYPDSKLLVTGHSLGAALATVMASDLLHREVVHSQRLNVITFGEPRVGNLEFARWYNSQPAHITRIVNENDIVPHLNPASLGYVNHVSEMYIQNNRSRICSSIDLEDVTCSLSRFPNLSVINHTRAWDLPLGVFAC
ncbi:hypothetical protein DSO57_1022222 [Entomophthora muscae]|uniref:Uncharacterized protein n=1 Tax=Entomophthora muscae TaxID=34485 RepID=A0ACC2SSC9_9FUNG|nr:hypothetical protein DSO57_1022222 [Entomophthora muscae]